MMRKKEVYKTITPIPAHIPRKLAVDILHSHGEIITLNPLVLEHHPVSAPRDAAADEYYATWYEITERIQYIPGMGKMGAGKISFKGCFHDVPWGVDTHILAPMNIDLRNNWRIAGNQPGEPPEARELGINAPPEGLYLREDIQIRCNFTMTSFVKAQLRAASKIMVERLIKKAELLDAGELHAMMENGKLKTLNPADRTKTLQSVTPQQPLQHQQQQPMSPRMPYQMPRSPTFPQRHLSEGDPNNRYSYAPNPQESQGLGLTQTTMELPGDFYHTSPTPDPSSLHPPSYYSTKRDSAISELSGSSPDVNMGRTSDFPNSPTSRPLSYVSDASSLRSPGLDHKSFAAELPTMEETREEYDKSRGTAMKHAEAYGTAQR